MEWKKISKETVYSGYRKVDKISYMLPNGKMHDFDITISKNACIIFPITSDGKVILSKQFRPGPGKVLCELPAGFIEDNETPKECAKRELLEETGYAGNLEYIGKTYIDAYSTLTRHHFIARDCKKVREQELDGGEFIKVMTATKDEFLRLLSDGNMTTAETGYMALFKDKTLLDTAN